MKKVKIILNCVFFSIKKKFFKSQKTDNYQECKSVLDLNEKEELENENQQEEYLKNYTITTRWQTI